LLAYGNKSLPIPQESVGSFALLTQRRKFFLDLLFRLLVLARTVMQEDIVDARKVRMPKFFDRTQNFILLASVTATSLKGLAG
jgi:hypothetical protein